ncbi:hypothetical protein COU57_03320 [Candidatus Pacearchaeota archaeon CG10_big_fil_rev_8_21_14_0_10_32_14]|nr:MAG: hypothetical protein COU57_03320 [Candidatus Pacearchaeota archaeon CG10_big_fil_rev_8_21_14_0_10_32_14]
MQKPLFISKTLFFPAEGILVIGDLHIGYEHMLHKSGIQISLHLTNQIINDLKPILDHVKAVHKINKIVFIGDLKHFFNFEYEEKKEFFKLLNFIEHYVQNPKEDIVLIKGNHDTSDFTGKVMKNVFIHKEIAFTHGHEWFKELENPKIKYIVMGHIHPSIKLSDKAKSEKFKCFLVGKFKDKEVIVLPSFFNVIEGTDVNDYFEDYDDHFSIIPKKDLLKFNIYAVNEEDDRFEVYDFGKIKDL